MSEQPYKKGWQTNDHDVYNLDDEVVGSEDDNEDCALDNDDADFEGSDCDNDYHHKYHGLVID